MSTKSANPTLDTNQVMAAGLAATAAAFVTSRFGVAGTLLGAGVTAMIITGGSAILKAYIENAAGRVRGGATRLRERRENPAPDAATEQGAPVAQESPPGRPDLRDNFAGRMRAALDWFRNLPTPSRRPILIKGLVATAAALVISLVVIWGFEKLIGNSLSCGLWGTCAVGAAPGIDPLGLNGTGAESTLSGGQLDVDGGGGVVDSVRQGIQEVPGGSDVVPPGGADSGASPDPGGGEPPSTASPGAEEPAPEDPDASASPAAAGKQAAPDAESSPAP